MTEDAPSSCCSTEGNAEVASPDSGRPPSKGTVRLKIAGMDCSEEVSAIKKALEGIVDAEALGFDTLGGTMDLPATADIDLAVAKIGKLGMSATKPGQADERPFWVKHRLNLITATSGFAVALGFALHVVLKGWESALRGEEPTTPVLILYCLAIVAGLLLTVPKAWQALRALRPDMNTLMTVAVLGAAILGEWFEAAAVCFLFALSLALEAWSIHRASRAVEGLLALSPPRVTVLSESGAKEVDPASVAVGSRFVVRPGERIGLDGAVDKGVGDVDQSPITGESVPVAKEPGDAVYAGTINGNSVLEIISSSRADDSMLAGIVNLVDQARRERSQAEQWVARFARIYTPLVFAAALLVMSVPPLLFSAGWDVWLYRGLVLLVVGCPCALVIATPVAVVAGLASAARHGVLVKGGPALEIPAQLRVVALDKTGTLTEGKLRVAEVKSLDDGVSTDQLLGLAAALESHSEHPIARAILLEHEKQTAPEGETQRPYPLARDVEQIPGRGSTGVIEGESYWIGSVRWAREKGGLDDDLMSLLEEHSSLGQTVVVMGRGDAVIGLLTLEDTVRPTAAQTVQELRRAGIERIVMLTGDTKATAAAVAAATGISEFHAELVPADKLQIIKRLQEESGPVAMAGDGVNDAPSLAQADVGVAMGALGTDVAIEAADVALMNDDLRMLPWLITHSRRTVNIIRVNTAFALATKAVFVVLTFFGMASLWGAIAADMGASLLVVANALRLLRSRTYDFGNLAPTRLETSP